LTARPLPPYFRKFAEDCRRLKPFRRAVSRNNFARSHSDETIKNRSPRGAATETRELRCGNDRDDTLIYHGLVRLTPDPSLLPLTPSIRLFDYLARERCALEHDPYLLRPRSFALLLPCDEQGGMVSIKSEIVDHSSTGLLAIEDAHNSQQSSREPSRVPSPLSVPSPFHDDHMSSTLSSPTLAPSRTQPVDPFLDVAPYENDYQSQAHLLPAEPVPLANPPPYRSISITLPAYVPRWQKHHDLESGGGGLRRQGTWTSLRRATSISKRYPKLPKYGWQIWSVIVLVTIITTVSIVIAVFKTANNGSSPPPSLSRHL
jgi:hypothetical protein